MYLTHWGWDKMAAILQMTLSNAFSWMKIYEFCLRFHWNLFPRFEWTIFHPSIVGSDYGLASTRRQAIIWKKMMVSLQMDICVTRPQWVKDHVSGCRPTVHWNVSAMSQDSSHECATCDNLDARISAPTNTLIYSQNLMFLLLAHMRFLCAYRNLLGSRWVLLWAVTRVMYGREELVFNRNLHRVSLIQ